MFILKNFIEKTLVKLLLDSKHGKNLIKDTVIQILNDSKSEMNFNLESITKSGLPVIVLSTKGSLPLARKVATQLEKILPNHLISGDGILGDVSVSTFDNGNIEVQVPNIRGKFVVIVHTMVPDINKETIELFAMLDAVRNASPGDTLALFSYMPFSRSDKKDKPRISVMAEVFPEIINMLGVKKVILVDAHDPHIKHFFHPAADEITTTYLIMDYLLEEYFKTHPKEECTLVFPDEGSAKRFHEVNKVLGIAVAHINKHRKDNSGDPEVGEIVGIVKGRHCILIDDEMLGGGTVGKDTERLLKHGALSVTACIVHPVLRKECMTDDDFFKKLTNMPVEKFIFTGTIPTEKRFPQSEKIIVLPVEKLLALAIANTVENKSTTVLYDIKMVPQYKL